MILNWMPSSGPWILFFQILLYFFVEREILFYVIGERERDMQSCLFQSAPPKILGSCGWKTSKVKDLRTGVSESRKHAPTLWCYNLFHPKLVTCPAHFPSLRYLDVLHCFFCLLTSSSSDTPQLRNTSHIQIDHPKRRGEERPNNGHEVARLHSKKVLKIPSSSDSCSSPGQQQQWRWSRKRRGRRWWKETDYSTR